MWMRSSQVVRASDCQCRSRNSPGFDPSILRHSGIWGAADEAVLKSVQRRTKNKKNRPVRRQIISWFSGKEPFVTGTVRKSLHWEFWHGHRKWPYITGSGRMSPEVAVCHRKRPYVTGSSRMSLEVCRSCLSYCEADVDRACWPKKMQLCVYSNIESYSCSKPFNTKATL